jgi:LuxR family transcriptional regulator, maltose regulon positive regulatory protein
LLEGRAREEQQVDRTRPQRFHRETLLLLSLAHVLQGHAAEAEQAAREGIAVGQRLGSAFVEAVGAMRLGHALQLQAYRPWEALEWSSSQAAIACYQRAIEQVRGFRVMRTQVEPLWGLCRAYGTHGDLDRAEQMARQALEITDRAGDGWMGALMHVTLGAAYVRVGTSPTAQEWLSRAERGFRQVGDPFGRSAACVVAGARRLATAASWRPWLSSWPSCCRLPNRWVTTACWCGGPSWAWTTTRRQRRC